MESSGFPAVRPSPRRELQGPRPTPLKVSKDSYKIKKPPAAQPPSQQPAAPPPPPVIIYTVSPKVIHTNPGDFMALVQRLTGASTSSSAAHVTASSDPSLPSPSYANARGGEALSPAARMATIERTHDDHRARRSMFDELDQLGITDGGTRVDRPGSFPGILSPVPSSLPPIPPNFFSHSDDRNTLISVVQEPSPSLHGGKSFVDNTFLVSPNNFLSSPAVPSPNAYWDLFNQFQDF